MQATVHIWIAGASNLVRVLLRHPFGPTEMMYLFRVGCASSKTINTENPVLLLRQLQLILELFFLNSVNYVFLVVVFVQLAPRFCVGSSH